MTLIYKTIAADAWAEAQQNGIFAGAAIDLADGYIHFSSSEQVEETVSKHFAGRNNLLLIAFNADRFGAALKWEISRGGALFPHFYGSLDPASAVWAKPLLLLDGVHVLPEDWRR